MNWKKEIFNLFMGIESDVIKIFSKNSSIIGDDCAYLRKTKQLISTDTIVENIHFSFRYFNDKQIAHRLIVSNYSDIQSSGGTPRFGLLNISFPKNKKKVTLSICNQINLLSKKLNIEIIGGDTSSSENFVASLTLISDKIDQKDIIRRSSAKIGDSIFIFQNLGFSKLGYLSINKKIKLPNQIKDKSHKQFLEPKFHKYHDVFQKLKINSSMDISDSLIDCLNIIANQSKKKLIIKNLDLVNPKIYKLFQKNISLYFKLILTSGEEYTPVFTMNKKFLTSKLLTLFKRKKINIIEIGEVTKGRGIECNQIDLKSFSTFDHFKNSYSN